MFSLTPNNAAYRAAGRATPRSMSGLSLVELMVALTLGLIFTGAVIEVYINAKQSLALNQAKTILHDDSRSTFRLIGQAIGHAGYRNDRDITQTRQSIFPVDGVFASGQVIRAQGLADGAWQLATRFQGNSDGMIGDCMGKRYEDDHLVTQLLTYDPDQQRLTCQTRCTITNANHLACSTQSAVISMQLRTLELLIGLDGTQKDNVPEHYVAVENLDGSERDILAIKVLGWFESTQNIYEKSTPQSITAFSGTITENDRKLRLRFTETFSARNRLP